MSIKEINEAECEKCHAYHCDRFYCNKCYGALQEQVIELLIENKELKQRLQNLPKHNNDFKKVCSRCGNLLGWESTSQGYTECHWCRDSKPISKS